MKLSFQHLFIRIQVVEVPSEVRLLILERIDSYERRVAKRRALAEGVVSVLSLVGIIYVFESVSQSMQRSGFFDYFNLLFMGDAAVVSYWRELGFSLFESIPAFSVAALLSGVIIFFWTGLRAVRNVRNLVGPKIA